MIKSDQWAAPFLLEEILYPAKSGSESENILKFPIDSENENEYNVLTQ